jgi:hypothetical protein
MSAVTWKHSPLLQIRYLLVGFAQGLFYSAERGCYQWTEDDATTEITITDGETLKQEVLQRRPAISFTRGPLQFFHPAFNDQHDFSMNIERETVGVLIPGTMTANCVARNDIESEQIAWVLAEHLWLFRKLLTQAGFFEIGRNISIGSPSPATAIVPGDMGEEYRCTAVSIPFQFPRLSSKMPLNAASLGNLAFEIRVRAHAALAKRLATREVQPADRHSGTALSYSADYPVQVCVSPPPHFSNASDAYGRTPGSDLAQNITKQAYPWDPARQVVVRTVRPNRAGSRLLGSAAAVPIPGNCVEQSTK